MKLTKSKLREIIKEEIQKLNEEKWKIPGTKVLKSSATLSLIDIQKDHGQGSEIVLFRFKVGGQFRSLMKKYADPNAKKLGDVIDLPGVGTVKHIDGVDVDFVNLKQIMKKMSKQIGLDLKVDDWHLMGYKSSKRPMFDVIHIYGHAMNVDDKLHTAVSNSKDKGKKLYASHYGKKLDKKYTVKVDFYHTPVSALKARATKGGRIPAWDKT
jgi:hypothetical protein